MFCVGQPVHPRDVNVRVLAGVHGVSFAAAHRGNEDAHNRVAASRWWIALFFGFACGRGKIHQRILRHLAFVHLQVRNRGGIRRPPICRGDLQLFGINPIKLAFAYFLCAALCKCALDWVYPEELEITTAYWWAPDSSAIAYLQMDESKVARYPLVDFSSPAGKAEEERYPPAGA